MKVNVNRTKTYNISSKKMEDYYRRYSDKASKYGFKKLSKDQLKQVIIGIRAENNRKGVYSSNVINTIVDRQRYPGAFSYKEAVAFRKAVGDTTKVKDLRNVKREVILEKYKDELSDAYRRLKDPKEIKKFNDAFGTNFKTAGEIISNYYFGS